VEKDMPFIVQRLGPFTQNDLSKLSQSGEVDIPLLLARLSRATPKTLLDFFEVIQTLLLPAAVRYFRPEYVELGNEELRLSHLADQLEDQIEPLHLQHKNVEKEFDRVSERRAQILLSLGINSDEPPDTFTAPTI
jgi:hypothetical protein